MRNIKYYWMRHLKKDEIVQIRSMKEALRIIDAIKEEKRHVKKKHKCKVDFIDIEARNIFSTKKVRTSMIQFANRHNRYGLTYNN